MSLQRKSVVNYKLRNEVDFTRVEFRGQTIPVQEFKRIVSVQRNLDTPSRTNNPTCDIRVYDRDDETATEFTDKDELKRNSLVIVVREPIANRVNYLVASQQEAKKISGWDGEYTLDSGRLQRVAERSDKIVTENIEGDGNPVSANATHVAAGGNTGSQFGTQNGLMLPPSRANTSKIVRSTGPRKGVHRAAAVASATFAPSTIKSLDVGEIVAQPLPQSAKKGVRDNVKISTTDLSNDSENSLAKLSIKAEDDGFPTAPVGLQSTAGKQEPAITAASAAVELKTDADNLLVVLKGVKSPKSESPDSAFTAAGAANGSAPVAGQQATHQLAVLHPTANVPPAQATDDDAVIRAAMLEAARSGVHEYSDITIDYESFNESERAKILMSQMKKMYDHEGVIKNPQYSRNYRGNRFNSINMPTSYAHQRAPGPNNNLQRRQPNQYRAGGVSEAGSIFNNNNSTPKGIRGMPTSFIKEVEKGTVGALPIGDGRYGVPFVDIEAHQRAAQPAGYDLASAAAAAGGVKSESYGTASTSLLLPGDVAGGDATPPSNYLCGHCGNIMLARKQPYKVSCCSKRFCYACLAPATTGADDQNPNTDREIRCPDGCDMILKTSELEIDFGLKKDIEEWEKLRQQQYMAVQGKQAAVSAAAAASQSQFPPGLPMQSVGSNGSIGGSTLDYTSPFVASVNPSLLPASMAVAAASGAQFSNNNNTIGYAASGYNDALYFSSNTNNNFGMSTSSFHAGVSASPLGNNNNAMYNNNNYQQPMNTYAVRNSMSGMQSMQQQQQQTGMFQQQQQQMMMPSRVPLPMGSVVNSNFMRSATPLSQMNVRSNTASSSLMDQQQQQMYNRNAGVISGHMAATGVGGARLSTQSQFVNNSAAFNPGQIRPSVMPLLQQQQQQQQQQARPHAIGASTGVAGVAQPQQYMLSTQNRVAGQLNAAVPVGSNNMIQGGMLMQPVMVGQRLQQQQTPMLSSFSNNNNNAISDDPLALFMSKMNDRDAERFTQRISVHERIGRNSSSNRSSTSDLHHAMSAAGGAPAGISASNSGSGSRRRSRSPLVVPSSSSKRITTNSSSLAQFDRDSLYDASALEAQQFLAANKAVLEASAAAAESASNSTAPFITIQARKRVRASFDGTPAGAMHVPKSKVPTPPEDTDTESRYVSKRHAGLPSKAADGSLPPDATGPLTDARSLLEAKRRRRQKVDGVTPPDASSGAAGVHKRKEIRYGGDELVVASTSGISPTTTRVVTTASSIGGRRLVKSSASTGETDADTARTKSSRHGVEKSSKRRRDDSAADDHRHRRRSDAVETDADELVDDDGNPLSRTSSLASSSVAISAKSRSAVATKDRSTSSADKKERHRHRAADESNNKSKKSIKKSRHHREEDGSESSSHRHRRTRQEKDRTRHDKDGKTHRRSHRSGGRSSREDETVVDEGSNGSTIIAATSADGDSTLRTPPSAGDDDGSRHRQQDFDDDDYIAVPPRPSSKLHRSLRDADMPSTKSLTKQESKFINKYATPSDDDDDDDETLAAAVNSNLRTPVSLDKRFSSSRLLVGALEQIRDQHDSGHSRSDSRASDRRTASRTREHSGRTIATLDIGAERSPIHDQQHVLSQESAKTKKLSSRDKKSSKSLAVSATSSVRAANDKKKVAAVPDDASTSSRHRRHHRRDRETEKQSDAALEVQEKRKSSTSGKIVKKSSSKVPAKSSKTSTKAADAASSSSHRAKTTTGGVEKKSVRKSSKATAVPNAASAQHDVLDLSSFPPVSTSFSVEDQQQYPVFTVNTRNNTTMRVDNDVGDGENGRVALRASKSSVSNLAQLQEAPRYRQQRVKSAANSSSSVTPDLPAEGNVFILASISPTKDITNPSPTLTGADQYRRSLFDRNAAENSAARDEVVLDVGYDEVAGFLGSTARHNATNVDDEDVDEDGDVDMDGNNVRRRHRHRGQQQNLLMTRTDSGLSEQSSDTMVVADTNAMPTTDDPMMDADDVFSNDDSNGRADVLQVMSDKGSTGRSDSKSSLIASLRQHRRHAKDERTEQPAKMDDRGRRSKPTALQSSHTRTAETASSSSKSRQHDSRGRIKRNVPVPTASSSKADKHEQRSRPQERSSTSSKSAGITTKSYRNATRKPSPPSSGLHHMLSVPSSMSAPSLNDVDSTSRTHSPHSAAYMAKNPLITITNRMAIEAPSSASGGVCSSIEMLSSLKHGDSQRSGRRNIADRLGDKRAGMSAISYADDSMSSQAASSIIGAKSKHFINSYLLPGAGGVSVVSSASSNNVVAAVSLQSVGITTSKHRSQSSSSTAAINSNRQHQITAVEQQHHQLYAQQQPQRVAVQHRVHATERVGLSSSSDSNKSSTAKDLDKLLPHGRAGRASVASSGSTAGGGRDGSVSSRSSPVDAMLMPADNLSSRRSATQPFESAIMGTHSTEHRREKARAGEDILRRNLMRAIHDHIKPQPQISKHTSGDTEML